MQLTLMSSMLAYFFGGFLFCGTPHLCVINLLLFLSGPCLESQCTLCGEPEGEWASPFPNSSCHRHLPPCCSAFQGGREAGKGDGGGERTLWCRRVVLQSSGQQSSSVSQPSGLRKGLILIDVQHCKTSILSCAFNLAQRQVGGWPSLHVYCMFWLTAWRLKSINSECWLTALLLHMSPNVILCIRTWLHGSARSCTCVYLCIHVCATCSGCFN